MKLSQTILILVLISIPIIAGAALSLENQYDGLNVSDSASDLFIYFVKMAIVFGVIIAVLVIIFNGINMILAQGEMAKIIMAKQRITAVFIGLLILLGVYVIATTINPNLVIIKIEDLKKIGAAILNNGGNNNAPTNTIEFQEVPLGTIAESILAANSSKRIGGFSEVVDELCYTYDKNGDTIDRNGDNQITPEGDTLRGVDMFYCIDQLNQAIIKKVKALNADYLCLSNTTKGPMREILKEIKSKDPATGGYNCNCTRCSSWPELLFPSIPYACQTQYTAECELADGTVVTGQAECDNHCIANGCCGSAYYTPNLGCQTSLFSGAYDHDPCAQTTRDAIDCARNEIKLRIDGQNLNESPSPPGAQTANGCAFTAFWEDPARDKEKFLTLNMAITRMESFEKYYNNHLNDLNAAVIMMRDPYGERISMAEFQTLKASGNQQKEITVKPFTGVNGNNYDPIKYCREFNCTKKNADGTCISGIRDELTNSLYAKEQEFDQFYNVPDFKDRRICQVDDTENKEKYSYSGDGATFYYREKFKYEETYEKETLRMVTDEAEKGYMESLIPLGEIVNDARKFTEKLLQFTKSIKDEVESVKTKSMEFAELPKKCDCSVNCNTHPIDSTSTTPEEDSCNNKTCGTNKCDNCSVCDEKEQGKCVCCEDCETVIVPDKPFYWCAQNGKVSGEYSQNQTLFQNALGGGANTNNLCVLSPRPVPYNLENILDSEYDAKYKTKLNLPNPIWMHSDTTVEGSCACQGESFWKVNPNYKGNRVCYGWPTCSIKGVCCAFACSSNSCWKSICKDGICESGELLGFTESDMENGFAAGSDAYNSAANANLLQYFYEVPQVSSFAYYPFYVDSCRHEGGKTIVTVGPLKTVSYTMCDGEEAYVLTDAEKQAVKTLNPGKDIVWIEGEDAIDVSRLGLGGGMNANGCCQQYLTENPPILLSYPAGLSGFCVIEDGIHKIRVTKPATSINALSERGDTTIKPPYYVCPVNDLKDKQCRIFKYSDTFNSSSIYPEDLTSGLKCTDASSPDGIGHLQKIDLLAKRIENYGKGKNLKPGDPDRWTVLDILNLSRNKLDKCITGYSLPLKEGAKSYTLLSCEEGIDTLSSGSATIFPSFPYPSVPDMWNCQPYNSSYLTVDQKLACLNNKQHPDCTNAIIKYVDDYYCLQRAE